MAMKVIQTDTLNSPTPVNYVPDTPTLAELLRASNRMASQNLRVAFPSAITKLRADQTVDIQPLFQKRYAGREPSDLPPIQNVRVLMPQGASYRLSFPLTVGDTGLTVILDRNMDSWMANTKDPTLPVDPSDTRAHHISDAVFIPGLVNDLQQTADTGKDLVLGNGKAQMRLGPKGTVSIQNSANELIGLINDLCGIVSDTLGALSAVPQTAVQAAALKAKATVLAQQLSTFKG
jgi:hypothetical protein